MGFFNRRKKIEILENEIKTYQMYIKPLEGLVKEIRARQHEFDNHMNAILNMHYTIDNYDDLVTAQSQYISEMYRDDSRQLLSLLKISDKILAGFLYSKILSAPDYINVNMEVRGLDILSSVSEHDLIEIIGTLVDNAFDACTKERNTVDILLETAGHKLAFQISNRVSGLTLEDIGHFFDRGYSTKEHDSASALTSTHGVGLYNAKKIAERYNGTLTVSLDFVEEEQNIVFRVEM